MEGVQDSKPKSDEAMPGVVPAEELKQGAPAPPPAPEQFNDGQPGQPKREANAVPKPQLGMPQFRNRTQAIPFDSQSEFTGRCEDWLLVPAKKYPLINWRLLFGGTGATVSPLTLIERETGAAILVRNMKRTVNRRPPGYRGGGVGGSAGLAEVQRFQEALAALQRAEREAAMNAVALGGTNEGIRGGDSNAAIPPTPKNEPVEGGGSGGKNGQLPADGAPLGGLPNLNLADSAMITPAPSSPAEDKKQLPAADEEVKAAALPVLREEDEVKAGGEKKADVASESKKGIVSAEKKKEDENAMDVDELDPQVKRKNSSDTAAAEASLDPRKAPENKDIGLHCWIVGTLQSEVDDTYARIQKLIDHAIKEYEPWLELQEESSEEEEEVEDESDEAAKGKDVVMEGPEEGGKDKSVEVKL
ncbi:hypothetical protein QFC19_008846 [Naganishia cerealis]|uniref:Uncharacterized protein n=1 Tax=Naganishia cerealis TaxID=610337 RepID=A0ACC2V0D8_9TREE|nr:hypothetical protein QFC19_008846 [Naganishia cerealis]